MRPRKTTRSERIMGQVRANLIVLAILFGVPGINKLLLGRGGAVADATKELWVWVWYVWIAFSLWAFILSVVIVLFAVAGGAFKMVDERGRE